MDTLMITLTPRKGQPVRTLWTAQANYEPPYLDWRMTRVDVRGMFQFTPGSERLPQLFIHVRLDPSTPIALRGKSIGEVRIEGYSNSRLGIIVRGQALPTPGEERYIRQNIIPVVEQWLADKLFQLERAALAVFEADLDLRVAEAREKLEEAYKHARGVLLRFGDRLEKGRWS